MITRRSILFGLLAAPIVVRTGLIMPVKALEIPKTPRIMSLDGAVYGGVYTIVNDGNMPMWVNVGNLTDVKLQANERMTVLCDKDGTLTRYVNPMEVAL